MPPEQAPEYRIAAALEWIVGFLDRLEKSDWFRKLFHLTTSRPEDRNPR